MDDALSRIAEKKSNVKRLLNMRRAVLALLSLTVAFITVWSLLKPAFSMQKKYYCGCEEHVHTEECYYTYLICGQEEGEEHTHKGHGRRRRRRV